LSNWAGISTDPYVFFTDLLVRPYAWFAPMKVEADASELQEGRHGGLNYLHRNSNGGLRVPALFPVRVVAGFPTIANSAARRDHGVAEPK
jgi:hypothetical protein